MGHGFFCEPLYRQRQLSANTHEQFDTDYNKCREPSIPYAIRNTQ
jgi:hypothetical protein